MIHVTLYILLTIGIRKCVFNFQPTARVLVDGEMFQHRMLLCGSTVHDDGYYYGPKRVVEVIVYMLTDRYEIIWTQIHFHIDDKCQFVEFF